jgi:DNA-binding transcriptional LysR family regulator
VTGLRRLRYFIAVAEERNFTRAAERLHIAQPALSRQIRALEGELGVELLHRTTHDFELTEAGAFLLDRGPVLLAAADRLWRDARTYGSGERGSVHVAYGASASYETAPRLLQEVTTRHPGIALTTEVKALGEIVAGVRDGTIDIGLVRCPPSVPGLATRTIRRERQGLLVRRDHPLAGSLTVPVAALAGETLLMHPRESNPAHYDAILELCRAQGVEPRIMLRNLSFDLRQLPVLQGEAVAIVGESSSAGLPDDLRWLPLVPDAHVDVVLLTRRHDRSPATDRVSEAAAAVAIELGWIGAAA